jgi:hypothetical protein
MATRSRSTVAAAALAHGLQQVACPGLRLLPGAGRWQPRRLRYHWCARELPAVEAWSPRQLIAAVNIRRLCQQTEATRC